MNLPDEFEHYLNRGIIRKVTQGKPRVRFLANESETGFEGLKERITIMGINDRNINSIIKDCYDVLMGLIRAKLLLDGYSSSGYYAHEAEISYLKRIGFSDVEIAFLNELRSSRNSIMYYGKIFNKEYAEKVIEFTNKIYPKLKEIIIRELII